MTNIDPTDYPHLTQPAEDLLAQQPHDGQGTVSNLGADPSEALRRPDLPHGTSEVLVFPTPQTGGVNDQDEVYESALAASKRSLSDIIGATKRDIVTEGVRQQQLIGGPDQQAERKSEYAWDRANKSEKPAGSAKVIGGEVLRVIADGESAAKTGGGQVVPQTRAEAVLRRLDKNGGAWKQHDRVSPQNNRLRVRGS